MVFGVRVAILDAHLGDLGPGQLEGKVERSEPAFRRSAFASRSLDPPSAGVRVVAGPHATAGGNGYDQGWRTRMALVIGTHGPARHCLRGACRPFTQARVSPPRARKSDIASSEQVNADEGLAPIL